MQTGDVVRFVLDQGANPADDVVAWMPAIYAMPAETSTTAPESVVRIACGRATGLTGADGNRWDADRLSQGGTPYTSENAVEGAATPALLQAGRVGATLRYAIPLPAGLYAVRLHWAETLCRQLGDRVFHVDINGRRVLRDFDVLSGRSSRAGGRSTSGSTARRWSPPGIRPPKPGRSVARPIYAWMVSAIAID